MRQCPSPRGNAYALITHRIDVPTCFKRQREFYHKCHRCQFAGQAADFCLDDMAVGEGSMNGVNGIARNGANGHVTADRDETVEQDSQAARQ